MGKITGVTEYLDAALRATTLRGKVIANNFANIDTPDYRRSEVDFEKLLAAEMESSRKPKPSEVKPEIVVPMNTSVNSKGNDVDMENEIGELVNNSVRNKTYLRILHKMYLQFERAMETTG